MDQAVEERGEVRKVFWRGEERSDRFSIRLQMELPAGGDACYDVTVGDDEGLFVIEDERCSGF